MTDETPPREPCTCTLTSRLVNRSSAFSRSRQQITILVFTNGSWIFCSPMMRPSSLVVTVNCSVPGSPSMYCIWDRF